MAGSAFRFDVPSATTTTPASTTMTIARATELHHSGTAAATLELSHMLAVESMPRLREAACCAIRSIANRSPHDESARPLKGVVAQLQTLARLDPDALVKSAASEAAAAALRAVASLAAWAAPPARSSPEAASTVAAASTAAAGAIRRQRRCLRCSLEGSPPLPFLLAGTLD